MPIRLETRLCERCWKPIPPGRACLVAHRRVPDSPRLSTRYRHLIGDLACTGAQAASSDHPATGSTMDSAPSGDDS